MMNRQQRLMTFANPADLPGYQDVSKANLQARKPRDLVVRLLAGSGAPQRTAGRHDHFLPPCVSRR